MKSYKLPKRITHNYLTDLVAKYGESMHLRDQQFVKRLAKRAINGESIDLSPEEQRQLLIAYAQTDHFATQYESGYLWQDKLVSEDSFKGVVASIERKPYLNRVDQEDVVCKTKLLLRKGERLSSQRVLELETIVQELKRYSQ